MNEERRVDGEERIETLIARALAELEDPTGAIVPGIQPSTTFERGADHELVGDFIYRREGSPTVRAGEDVLARLEGGVGALLFSSGMAAFAAFMAAQPRGARVIAPRVMYHGAQDWLHRLDSRGDISLHLFDRLDNEGLSSAVSEGADVVWIESPMNPTWEVIDIEEAGVVSHRAGAILAVDSTVAPPVTTRPLQLGADCVFHSGTKYLNGHSDVTAGVLVSAVSDELWGEVQKVRTHQGSAPSPFDVWLLLRGLRTLGVRYERISDSALAVARAMESQRGVESVLYPGLTSHPHHDIAKRQMRGGYGGMLSLLVDGSAEATQHVATATELFRTATSLGGTESLIEHRSAVEGPHSVVPENLLRLSIGLEHPTDLIADLEQAFDSAFSLDQD